MGYESVARHQVWWASRSTQTDKERIAYFNGAQSCGVKDDRGRVNQQSMWDLEKTPR